MIERLNSAIVMLLLIIPITIIGGKLFTLGAYLLSILALKEMMDMREKKKLLPIFVKFISYIFLTLIFFNFKLIDLKMMLDIRMIAGLVLVYFVPNVLYHSNEKYDIDDSFYLLGSVLLLGIAFSILNLIRLDNIHLLVYLFLVTTLSDTFGYVFGMIIGKNKLVPAISPKKTWEGTLGGTFMATALGVMFYTTIINPDIMMGQIVFITLFLSILGQFGDLVFSSIKRFYKQKDFSNLIPGHGGILDRTDSIIFVLIGAMFFFTIL